jgi:heterotetrameric sarcosine oxidase gamma subunit
VSLDFLTPSPEVLAHSPMERCARAAGARFEARDGWLVAVAYDRPPAATGWADMSHLGKLEVAGPPQPAGRNGHAPGAALGDAARSAGARSELGQAELSDDAWWCPITPRRSLVLAEPAAARELRDRLGARAVDVTTAYAALAIVGPDAREVLARQCALDLRPHVTPVGAFRPGSVARTPAYVLREAEERYLVLFGAALGEYMWTVLADAAEHLGGAPIGADALREAPAHA